MISHDEVKAWLAHFRAEKAKLLDPIGRDRAYEIQDCRRVAEEEIAHVIVTLEKMEAMWRTKI